MTLHLRPLGVRQHESVHPKLESQSSLRWNPHSQQALGKGATFSFRVQLSRSAAEGAVTFEREVALDELLTNKARSTF
jgi:hypothetical protein